MDSKSLCSILLILTVIKTARAQSSSPILFGGECNHYYDYPIDICFSVNSSLTGLRSYKYICNLNNTGYDDYNIRLNIYNGTNDCSSNNYGLNSTLIYNLTMNDLNGTEPYNKFISCRGEKSCPYFKGRWYITKILTESPTLDPTNQPSIDPTPTPSSNPTITNGTHNPTIYPSTSPSMEPTYTPIMPSFSPSMTNDTISPTISPSESTLNPSFAPTPTPTYGFPYLQNETCAISEENMYYQDIVYVINTCLPYRNRMNDSDPLAAISKYDGNITNMIRGNNGSAYLVRQCIENKFQVPLQVASTLFLNDTCNNSMIDKSTELDYDNGQCYNFTDSEYFYDDIANLRDIRFIDFDSEREWYKFQLLECNFLIDLPQFGEEYLFYEYDLIASWTIMCLSALMLITYTVYIFSACDTVKKKPQYHETGILLLDDNFSESRLAVLVFQWFALFALFLNSLFNFLNSWSIIDLEDEDQCNLIMSALDLTWHWGKGFLYISLMSRIVLVMEGLDQNKYQIPGKILKLFAFEIVAYFLLTPVLDLVTTRADHRLYQFIDERQTLPVYVCGEVIEYWISFLLAFGDLILCSTTIGVYLYAVGEMIIEPISNQKLIDICIRYAIFSIFASIFIMIGNGVWATNSFSTARYIDVIFCVFSIMYLLTVCTSCYNSCCSNCHKKLRTSYITHFLYIKEGLILKEFNEIRNNPKYVLKSYDRSFDQKLTQILESANLANHDSLDTYHQNVALHHAHSNIKSKKKLKKIKKRILKQQQLRGKDGKQTPNVNLNDRELQAIARLVEFSSKNRSAMNSMRHLSTTTGMQSNQSESKESSQTGTNTTKDNNSNILTPSVNINDDGFEYNEYSAINANLGINPEDSAIISIKKGVKKKKKKKIGYKNVGLLAKLNPDDSHLPKSLTIAIHASVIDTVKLDKESKEMTEREKIDKKMDELYTKVDTYWDENIILFPRRSPTIYPGQAYKLTKAEKFALQERKEEIEKQEYSDPDNYSDEFNDSDDEELQTQEREWSKSARKHGDGKNLDHIYEILEDIEDKDLLTIWDLLDKENQKKVDYRDGLVKLLGAFFLLYFRKKAYNGDGGYTQIHEQPPKFNELEPVLVLLAKFIRDTLRKKKKKFLKKSDYQKNFKKYLREAIEKRNKFLDKRKNKLKSQSSLVSMTSNNGHIIMDNMNTNTSSPNMNGYVTSFTTNGLSSVSEYKIEEEDDEYDDKMMAALSKDGMGMKGMKMKLPNTNLPTIMSEGWNKIEEEEPNEDNKLDTADHDDMMAALDHFDAFVDDDKKHRNKQKNERQESRFNDDEAAQIELQKMMDNYTPRESTNKLMMKKIYKEEEEEAKYQDPKLKIDAQMAELQKRRAKHQQQLSDKGTVNMTLLMNGNAKQNKNKNTLTTIVDNDNPWNDKDKKQNSNPTEIDMDIDSIDVTNILNNINDADDTPIVSLTTPVQQQQQPTTGDTGFDSDVDIDAIRLSDAAERKEQEEKEKKEANNKDLLPSTDINETGKSSSLFDVDDLLQHVDSQDLVIPPDTPTSPTVTEHEQQHNKDARSDATEIFNPNAIEPKKHKVVVIDEKNIKQENEEEYQDSKGKDNNNHTQQESLKVTDDLMNAALSAMDSNNNSDKHETNETMVEIKQDNNNNNKSNNNTMASMELDQGFMNDVLSNIDMGDD